jgi:hypothetical protein
MYNAYVYASLNYLDTPSSTSSLNTKFTNLDATIQIMVNTQPAEVIRQLH